MFPEKRSKTEIDCPICYAPHDEEIHEATLRIRHWFRYQVTHMLREEEFFGEANGDIAETQVA
jgi:hypothetical protein